MGTPAKGKISIRRMLILLAGFYFALCLLCGIFQRKLLYVPMTMPADEAAAVAAENGFQPWKNSAGEIIGWKIPANGAATGSVLIVHGNGGSAGRRNYLAQPIHDAAAVDVFVLEYPGYGARPGSPSQTSLVAAAEEAFQLLPAGLPKYVVSESLGTGVAGELAKAHPAEIVGLAMFVPYQNLPSVAQRRFWYLPAYFVLLDRFNPTECLQNYHGPVKFIVAGADEIIGAASGLRLAEGYSGPKELQVLPKAGHNEVTEQSPGWWREVFEFWRKNAAVGGK